MSAGGTGQATGPATGPGGDRPVRDPAGAAGLERRYRRLLRCYPPSHREFHREEMLGVLLATARPGQRTPGLRGTVNLAACGLAIRVRRIPGWLAADAGQDALAVVSLIAPAVVVILIALAPGGMNVTAAARVPFWTFPPFPPSSLVVTAWLALTVPLLGPGPWRIGPGGLVQSLGQFGGIPVVLASLAACSLAFSPGPRRGLAVVGWWRACLMIAALSAGFGFPFIVLRVHPAALALTGDLAFRLLGILAIAVAVAVTCVRGPVGRRVAGLIATGLLPSLALATIPLRDVPAVILVPTLVSLLAAVLVWPVAIISWRGRAGSRRRLAEPDLDFTVVYAEFQAFCSRRRLPASSTPQLERAWDAWQAGRYRRGEISQWPGYGDNPFRPR